MKRVPLMLAAVAVLALSSASAGEKVEEELAKLRKEVTALRLEVAKLVAQRNEHKVLLKQLMAIAVKLKAGEKLADGFAELTAIEKCVRRGGDLGSRAMGLLSKLPSGQRCAILGVIVADVTVYNAARQAALRQLVTENNAAARKAIHTAIAQERLLPARAAGGYNYSYNNLKPHLALAAGSLKDKAAVSLSIECLDDLAARAERTVAQRKTEGGGRYSYGASIHGMTRTLVSRLKTWSGQEGLAQFTVAKGFAKGRRNYGYYRVDSQEKVDALKGELAKLKTWWKEKEGEFKFPAGAVAPAETDPPAKVKKPVKGKRPVEQF